MFTSTSLEKGALNSAIVLFEVHSGSSIPVPGTDACVRVDHAWHGSDCLTSCILYSRVRARALNNVSARERSAESRCRDGDLVNRGADLVKCELDIDAGLCRFSKSRCRFIKLRGRC